jgi:hypothetical protein
MILENITITSLGALENFSFVFADGLNLLHTHRTDEITQAIRILLNHKDITPFPQDAVRADTRIEATVFIEKKQYKLIAVPDTVRECFSLKAYNAQGGDATSEYLYLTDHCAEQDRADAFEGTDQDMPLRFLQYANEELYFARNELSKRTGDLSNLKAFRAYLRYFIAHFQPEPIRDGKQYEIILRSDGRYDVRHKNDRGMPVYLSESEQILFRYLCFLRTAEFWRGFEEIRNIHGVKKPLIIKDFLERLDESIDISDIIGRTAALGRQVVVLV